MCVWVKVCVLWHMCGAHTYIYYNVWWMCMYECVYVWVWVCACHGICDMCGIYIYIICIYICIHMYSVHVWMWGVWVWVCGCHSTCVEVRRWLGCQSLPPTFFDMGSVLPCWWNATGYFCLCLSPPGTSTLRIETLVLLWLTFLGSRESELRTPGLCNKHFTYFIIFLAPHLSFLRQGLSLNPELTDVAVSIFLVLGLQVCATMHSFLCGF